LKKTILKRAKKSKINRIIKIILILIFIIIFLIVFSNGRVSEWNGKNKLSIVVEGDNIAVMVFDPLNREITNIKIPGNTEVIVSRQLGMLKIKNVWKLGDKQGIDGGKLLAETTTRYLRIPVSKWADQEALALVSGNRYAIIRTFVIPYKTNLSILDKLRLSLFSLNISNSKINSFDLTSFGYIEESLLRDGSNGFVLTERFPNQLLAILADTDITKNQVRVNIKNATGDNQIVEKLSGVIAVLGGKVSLVSNESLADTDCVVSGFDAYVIKLIELFDCKKASAEIGGLFDVEMQIGSQFVKRY